MKKLTVLIPALLLSASVLVCLSGCSEENSSSSTNHENKVQLTGTYASHLNDETKTTAVTSQTLPRLTTIETLATKAALVTITKSDTIKDAESIISDFEARRKEFESLDELHTIDWSKYNRGSSDETTTTVDTDE